MRIMANRFGIAAALVALASGLMGAAADDEQAQAQVGEPAPDFTLTDSEGEPVTLSDVRKNPDGENRVVVLEWVNPDCPFVQRHYEEQTMQRLYDKYHERGVAWLQINTTEYMNQADHAAWKEKHQLPWPVLNDNRGEVARRYEAKTTPHMYVIDRDGTLVYAGAIDNDPRGNLGDERVNYVDEALQQVLAGEPVSQPETRPYGCSVKYAQ